MTSRANPYNWQQHTPRQSVHRGTSVATIAGHLRRGAAVKVIGGRGMGKSVLLQQVQAQLLQDAPGTRVLLVPGPPEEPTVAGAVRDLAARLGVRDLAAPRMDDLLERVLDGDTTRLVVLFDEADQYVTAGEGERGAFARSWFNKLEVTRKQHGACFDLVFAGGIGLFYLESEVGSGIVSRAEPCVLDPFGPAEISVLARPFEEDGRSLDDICLDTLRVMSGGIPVLVTYGLENLWDATSPSVQALEQIFGVFRERHDGFVRAARSSVSQHGRLDAPRRVLKAVREHAGSVPMQRLRDACALQAGEHVSIDPEQALKLLRAAGLVRVEGSMLADPVAAWPIASILNLPEIPASSGDPIERLIQDVCAALANLRRVGRDFHGKSGLLEEQVFSSFIAAVLAVLGWETEREAIQVAGFTDVKVRLTRPGLDGHALIETKIWRGAAYNQGIQKQIADYRVSDSLHGIAVTLGVRDASGWPDEYERTCLAGCSVERLPTPPDLVARWRVQQTDPDGKAWLTDHLVVQLPKRR
ncbi:AAA family ATPase [Sorangium sp. So ce1335]|uniref:AAA family ATPase n=1 Tax=Sorangium sp. So ce1335 TaxID=3133335 RepID=UPI003F631650